MQLSIMNMVKDGKVSIDEALYLARRDQNLEEVLTLQRLKFPGYFIC